MVLSAAAAAVVFGGLRQLLVFPSDSGRPLEYYEMSSTILDTRNLFSVKRFLF